ncbi:hypothetical protein [Klebsiella quasipneumoniae]|uniref:hypothetical protein n=1 Tax=Klebsiella quasipneumoniae TaxID=1463165 RepID=UPI00358DB1E0
MRRHSPFSAVTDEKKGSTITLQAVNELIQSLESAGEPSIREQKFLKLAKEFRICSASLDAAIKTGNMLADQNAQLAAENVALKAAFHPSDIPSEWTDVFGDTAVIEHDAAGDNQGHSISWSWVDNQEEVIKSVLLAVDKGIETPATDRIVAGIKADGVEQYAALFADTVNMEREHNQQFHKGTLWFAKQLREGADKC